MRKSIALLGVLFAAWSARFIWSSSFIAIDGQRHFSLFDDAMVSMRYAWQLSHDAGLVWNVGERVEGYTNLLMTLVMAGVIGAVGRDLAPLIVQVLGVATVLICALLAVQLSDRLAAYEASSARAIRQCLVAGAVLALYPLVYWAEMGMETGLLTALLLAATVTALDARLYDRLPLLGLLLGLAYLTRPDAAVSAAILFVFATREIVTRNGVVSGVVRRIGLSACVLLAFPLAQTMFRMAYYGELVPNTYTLKMEGLPLALRLGDGWTYLRAFLPTALPALAVIGVGVLPRVERRTGLLLALVVSAAAYQVWVGGDVWQYWRMLTPVLPLLIVLVVYAAQRLTRSVVQRLQVPNLTTDRLVVASMALITLASVVSLDFPFRREIVFRDRPYHALENERNTNVGLALNAITRPTATAAVFWAGALPYYADRPAIDMLGKSDKVIANLPPDISGVLGGYGMVSLPGHNKYDLDYSIKQLQPTFAQWVGWGRQDLTAWASTRYDTVLYRGVWLLVRRDSPDVLWDRVEDRVPLGVTRTG